MPTITNKITTVASVNDWFSLTLQFPEYSRLSNNPLNDYGYMAVMSEILKHKSEKRLRVLEFGHMFKADLFKKFEDKAEMWGIDDIGSEHYIPQGKEWEDAYNKNLLYKCPSTHFVRGYLGRDMDKLPLNYFDIICSISVYDNISTNFWPDVTKHAYSLLRPGGVFINTYGYPIRNMESRISSFIENQREAGFEVADAPQQMDGDPLIESQFAVMVYYQKQEPAENRRYWGNRGSVLTISTKQEKLDDHLSYLNSSTKNFKTFCMYGFYHINITTEGKANLCCRASKTIKVNGRDLSIHQDTFNEIWNSSYMRDVRHRMVFGQSVEACSGCYRSEEQGGISLRDWANSVDSIKYTTDFQNLNEIYENCKAIVTDHDAIAPHPSSIHFWLGNLCNLKCRMCNPTFSSQIANDPLHSSWTGSQERKVTLLPDFIGEVKYQGFSGIEFRGVNYRLLTSECNAHILFANTGNSISRIELSGFKDDNELSTLVISIGNDKVIHRQINSSYWDFKLFFDPPIELLKDIEIGIRFEGASSKIGIRNLVLASATPFGKAFPKEFVSRIIENPKWYENENVLMNEILESPETIRFISFAGGEPMLHKKLETILQNFVDKGLSKRIMLHFSTNGTVKTPKISALLKEFCRVGFGVSIDGMGELQEYIRPPVKWDIILDNVLGYFDEKIVNVSIQPTPQVYNLFGLFDLVNFCDKLKIPFTLNNILYYPAYLSFDMLPQSLVQEVSAKWKKYRDDCCRAEFVKEINSIIGALERPRPANRGELQENFIKFTKDLDKARNQSLKTASPELYQKLLDYGFEL